MLLAGTGAGIGRACALAFAEAGARVACVDLEQGRADEVADALRAAGAEALALQADVRRREDVAAAVELAARAVRRASMYASTSSVKRAGDACSS